MSRPLENPKLLKEEQIIGYLPPAVKDQVKGFLIRTGRTQSQYVRDLIFADFKSQGMELALAG